MGEEEAPGRELGPRRAGGSGLSRCAACLGSLVNLDAAHFQPGPRNWRVRGFSGFLSVFREPS